MKTTRNFRDSNCIQLIPNDKKENRKLYTVNSSRRQISVCVFVKLIMTIDRQYTNQIKAIRYPIQFYRIPACGRFRLWLCVCVLCWSTQFNQKDKYVNIQTMPRPADRPTEEVLTIDNCVANNKFFCAHCATFWWMEATELN